MKHKTGYMIAVLTGVLLVMGVTAAASVYIADNMKDAADKKAAVTQTPTQERVVYQDSAPPPAVPACDDDNIVGKVVGGAAGGLVGSQFGKGNGKTAATVGGAVGGTILGEEYVPTKNVTCR